MNRTRALALPVALGLTLLLGCGGSSGNSASADPGATGPAAISYTNPSATGYRLVKDDARSTPTHLVLNLVAPAGADLRGCSLALEALPAVAAWGPVTSGDPSLAQNPRFDLGPDPKLTQVVKEGGRLSFAFFQKGTSAPSVNLATDSVIASLALDLNPAAARPSDAVLTVLSGRAVVVTAAGAVQPVTVGVGRLQVP